MNLRSSISLVFVTTAVALGACMKPNPLVYTLGDDETGTSEATEGDGDGDGDDTSASTTGDGDGDESETRGEPPEPMPDLGTLECEPLAEFGPECGLCLAEGCCDLATACAEDPNCVCVTNCKNTGGANGQCKQDCGVKPGDVPAYQALSACMADACGPSC